jgi:hypothetical protein
MIPNTLICNQDGIALLNSKLDDIRTLYQLLQSHTSKNPRYKSRRKSTLVNFKFLAELDGVIDRLEELYYKYYIKNNPTKTLSTEIEEDIALSHKMKALLPYAIALGMMADE